MAIYGSIPSVQIEDTAAFTIEIFDQPQPWAVGEDLAEWLNQNQVTGEVEAWLEATGVMGDNPDIWGLVCPWGHGLDNNPFDLVCIVQVDSIVAAEHESTCKCEDCRRTAAAEAAQEVAADHGPAAGRAEYARLMAEPASGRSSIMWEMSGAYGADLDVATCTYPGCGFTACMETSGSRDLDDFGRWVHAHGSSHPPVALLNTSIVTTDGDYRLKSITPESAVKMAGRAELDSAIGHPSTAEILSTILGREVPVNRQLFAQKVGQAAIVFKLNGRPEPGKELSRDELEIIGFSFKLLTRIA